MVSNWSFGLLAIINNPMMLIRDRKMPKNHIISAVSEIGMPGLGLQRVL